MRFREFLPVSRDAHGTDAGNLPSSLKTGDHANRGGERHGDKEPNEAKQSQKPQWGTSPPRD
jgi:hypothetical protein